MFLFRRLSLFAPLTIFAALITPGCVTRSHPDVGFAHSNEQSRSSPTSIPQVNINTASARELEALPGIGKALAQRIIDHREKYGRFRKVEHLLIVRGISDKRFQDLRELITVE